MNEESEKPCRELNTQKINTWSHQYFVETVRDLLFYGSKITVNGDYGYQIKRHLLFGGKAIINLDIVL